MDLEEKRKVQDKKTAALLICIVLLCVICLFAVAQSQIGTDWSVKIVAAQSHTPPYSADCTFGVKAGATNSFDSAYDQIAAPSPAVGVNTYFAYPNDPVSLFQKLSTSFIPDSNNLSWTYKVQTLGVGGAMTLSWPASDAATVPSGFNIYLADSTGTTNLRDMRSTTSYTFSAEADTTSTFTIKLVAISTPTPAPTPIPTPTSSPILTLTPTTSTSPASTANPTANPSSNTTPGHSTATPSSTPQIPEYSLGIAVLMIVAVYGIMITIKKTQPHHEVSTDCIK